MKMNKICCMKWLCILIVLTWTGGACSRDYLEYDTKLKDGIYLMTSDTANYTFGLEVQGSTYDYLVITALVGMPSDKDRAIGFEVVDTATTAVKGVHYELNDDGVLKAGEVRKSIRMTLIRDKDELLKERPVTLTVRLTENENFRLLPGMTSKSTLIFSDQGLLQPLWWNVNIKYLGPYSERLYRDFMHYYWKIKEVNPSLYTTMEEKLGKYIEKTKPSMTMFSDFRIPLLKYVISPIYEYYEQNPDPNVKIPKPQF